jgi:hypothetical protein
MKRKDLLLASTAESSTDTGSAAGFLTVDQLLQRVPISRRTLSAHRAKGRIPWINLGGRVLFDWESVRNALLRQQRGGE